MSQFTISYRDIFQIIKDNFQDHSNTVKNEVYLYIMNKFDIDDSYQNQIQEIFRTRFFNNFNAKLKHLRSKKKSICHFETEYEDWLNLQLDFSINEENIPRDAEPSNYV